MATYQNGFQLGILPERKIDKRALVASYTFMVVLLLLLVNLGILFPDRISLKQYRVTELIPMPIFTAFGPMSSHFGARFRNSVCISKAALTECS